MNKDNTLRNYQIFSIVVMLAFLIGSAVATVKTTGDWRCLFTNCVVVK